MPTPKPDQPALYLIDGHAQMFRAFFAIRSAMTSPVTGEPTNALFAFAGMLIKLYRDFSPTHVAMVTDGEGPTFRDELFDQYKANREAPPEDFEKQIPRMLEMAELFGIPVITIDGVEADDVMATLATRVEAGQFDDDLPGMRLRLVAKDKDLEQVLSPRVELCDLQTDTYLDVDALKEKRGITPQQVIDYQALIGDPTDNVPGVKGIGPKTAAKLIDQFGSLDNLTQHTDQLKGKQKENLEHAIQSGQLEVSRKLVTLKTDVDVELDLAACETRGMEKLDGPGILTLFRELGFNRHVKDLKQLLGDDTPEAEDNHSTSKKNTKDNSNNNSNKGGRDDAGFGLFAGYGNADDATNTTTDATLDGEYHAVRTEGQLQQLVADLEAADIFAFDTETIGLGADAELCGLSFAWKPNHGVYVPIRSPEPDAHLTREQVLTALSRVLEDPDQPKIGHNLKYDLLVLRHAGVEARGAAFDTMIAAFLCNAPGMGMDDLALGELGHTCIPITDLIGHKPTRKSDPPQKSMDQVPLELVAPYAAEDADITFRLYEKLKPRLKTLGVQRLAEDVEMPLVEVLTDMQFHGIRVDPEILREQQEKLAARADELRREVLDAAGFDFNPDSTKQLGEALFD
ncbi:MAG: 5'-3' exonuclease H3TH domain-containing protein, partial [Phycisphaeraceae bacterium]